jgi:hypothetical protein
MDPSKAADAIRAGVGGAGAGAGPSRGAPLTLTVADAAATGGLALRDAEMGLKWLSTEYRGQLRVTAGGDLVHVFPAGLTKPWEGRDARRRVLRAAGRGLSGAVRFVVRAWVAVVLVAYAALFVTLLLAAAFTRQGGDSRRSDGLPGGALAYAFLRVVGDALFWTFHPWSPFYVGEARSSSVAGRRPYRASGFVDRWGPGSTGGSKVPLYERVNRFFFGPPPAEVDPRENERLLVAAIRAGKGRIGVGDVMRVTGLPREQADPLMARLMLDYEGDVGVSEEGGIVYRFPSLRRTASSAPEREPPASWARSRPLPPLTGNPLGANVAIAVLNGFNLLTAGWAIQNGMTLERVAHLFDRVPPQVAPGTPIVLGVVPLVFSLLLFLLPMARAAARPWRERRAKAETARLAVLREVLERVRRKQPVTTRDVDAAWTRATGDDPDEKKLDRALVDLGGELVVEDDGGTHWRFADLETEASAVEAERAAAADDEARLEEIVYATDR